MVIGVGYVFRTHANSFTISTLGMNRRRLSALGFLESLGILCYGSAPPRMVHLRPYTSGGIGKAARMQRNRPVMTNDDIQGREGGVITGLSRAIGLYPQP